MCRTIMEMDVNEHVLAVRSYFECKMIMHARIWMLTVLHKCVHENECKLDEYVFMDIVG